MRRIKRILVIQTAFLGDVILTLPLLQVLKDFFFEAEIDVVVVPRSAEVCRNHPAVHEIILYDKRNSQKGLAGLLELGRSLRKRRYDFAVVPHRSLRSALLPLLAGIPLRIGFKKSAGRLLFSKRVQYRKDLHEIERNLSLLGAIGIGEIGRTPPRIYPGNDSAERVTKFLTDHGSGPTKPMVTIAPGTIWNTKRWLKDRFAEVARALVNDGFQVLLVGGAEDAGLCREIQTLAGSDQILSSAGTFSLLESAEAIRRSRIMISNDSAPMHLAVAVGTPVVGIFGATVPAFGFAPYGSNDVVVETRGLRCRPCSVHGGDRCPIETFECMLNISADRVFAKALEVLNRVGEVEREKH
ncbi:MAG: lipopolysaccharide heptosyltransferase II [Ignavibacteriales bacterium]|nr:lipopolysaccharide heptosyltransferase II [Ignavibacteriales bacterium]